MGWERKRGKLHELNLLLRGDARHDLPAARRAAARRRRLCDDARRRHAHDARRGRPRWSASSAIRSTGRSSTRRAGRVTAGYAHPAAARHAVADDRRRGLVLPARLLGQPRPRPLCLRRLRPLPGRVRRRLLHRQGPLPRRRVRGGAEGPHRRKHRAQPRSARRRAGALRRWSPTSRWSRTIRPATRSTRRASIAGRAATGSCCRYIFDPQSRRAGAVALEDDRQSAPLADADLLGHGGDRRLDAAAVHAGGAVAGAADPRRCSWRRPSTSSTRILPKSREATARGHFSALCARRRLRHRAWWRCASC